MGEVEYGRERREVPSSRTSIMAIFVDVSGVCARRRERSCGAEMRGRVAIVVADDIFVEVYDFEVGVVDEVL